jgi:hypothetical protein
MSEERRQSRIYRSMASVFHRMVHDACDRTGDTEEDVAAVCLLGHKSHLNNMSNGHAPLAVDVLIRFTRRYGDRRGIEELLRLSETERPESNASDVMRGLMESTRDALEFHKAALEVVDDGEVTRDEYAKLERELNELITSAKGLVGKCEGLRRGRRLRDEV